MEHCLDWVDDVGELAFVCYLWAEAAALLFEADNGRLLYQHLHHQAYRNTRLPHLLHPCLNYIIHNASGMHVLDLNILLQVQLTMHTHVPNQRPDVAKPREL